MPKSPRELKSERIDLEGEKLERWTLADSDRSLVLTHQFHDRATAMDFLGITTAFARHVGACPKIEHLLGRVRVGLTTYEHGTVTVKDHRLARILERTLDFLEASEATP